MGMKLVLIVKSGGKNHLAQIYKCDISLERYGNYFSLWYPEALSDLKFFQICFRLRFPFNLFFLTEQQTGNTC